MEVRYHSNFIKNFNKRFKGNKKFKERYENRLTAFIKDPENILLKDHQLIGKKLGLRAFSITGDVRVVYFIKDNIAFFLDIGSHNQVY